MHHMIEWPDDRPIPDVLTYEYAIAIVQRPDMNHEAMIVEPLQPGKARLTIEGPTELVAPIAKIAHAMVREAKESKESN